MPSSTAQLPDVLRRDDGSRVVAIADWRARRKELLDHFATEMFGPMPPVAPVSSTLIARWDVRDCPGMKREGWLLTIATEPAVQLVLDIYRPEGSGPFPVLVNGDGCWRYVTDDVLKLLLDRRYAMALFNRTVIMPDLQQNYRDCALVRANPRADYRAIAAWAWGYHRVADFLLSQTLYDRNRLGTCGHSRGGKTSLLAGATDERFTLVSANGSGCGGAGCLRYIQSGAETVGRITKTCPFWFAERFADYAGRESDLPIDSHDLKALVAPRALLSTEAFGDVWASPAGTLLSHEAALPAFALHDAADKIAIHFRKGDHRHDLTDFQTLIDFADAQWFGRDVASSFNNPAHAAQLKAEPLTDSAGNTCNWPVA